MVGDLQHEDVASVADVAALFVRANPVVAGAHRVTAVKSCSVKTEIQRGYSSARYSIPCWYSMNPAGSGVYCT